MKLAIGTDVGGTNIKGILLNEKGEIPKQHFAPTNDMPDSKWRELIFEMVEYLKMDAVESVALIGLSCPGFANENNKCVAHLPNRLSVAEHFIWEAYFGSPTFLINDAHAALIAEATFGALNGFKNAVLLTLGTGVGGGILINGELYQGLHQRAGHFGHTCINPYDDELSILGMPGSLEYAIGNYSVKRRSPGHYQSMQELVAAYLKNDHFATWLWLDCIRKTALTIASIANSLCPEIIILAVGITKAGKALFEPLQQMADIYEFRPKGKLTIIRQAIFRDLSGAVGAAAFAFNKSNLII